MRRVGTGQPRERRRHTRPADFQWSTGDDAYERCIGGGERREENHVVLDDDVGPVGANDVPQPWLAVLRSVDERLIRRLDEGLELLDGWLAELGRGLGDEIRPERARILLVRTLGGCGEVDEFFDEAERTQLARP